MNKLKGLNDLYFLDESGLEIARRRLASGQPEQVRLREKDLYDWTRIRETVVLPYSVRVDPTSELARASAGCVQRFERPGAFAGLSPAEKGRLFTALRRAGVEIPYRKERRRRRRRTKS